MKKIILAVAAATFMTTSAMAGGVVIPGPEDFPGCTPEECPPTTLPPFMPPATPDFPTWPEPADCKTTTTVITNDGVTVTTIIEICKEN